jgi:acetyl-CoA synthetase
VDDTTDDTTVRTEHETTIRKDPRQLAVSPNLADDPDAWAAYEWSSARDLVDGLPDDSGLNMAYECLDRHVAAGNGERVAIRWIGRDGEELPITFAALASASARFAMVLRDLGVAPGERVFMLTGRIPDLYTAVLGTLRHRGVVCTLFAAFGPEPIRQRLALGDARVLVTTAALYRRKVAGICDQLPGLAHVLLVDGEGDDGDRDAGAGGPVVRSLAELMAAAEPDHTIAPTAPDDLALLHFTSGTTGTPKGAMHVHGAIVAHQATARWALDLREGDVYWCTADPGWVTGTSYGILAPLALGVTSVVDEGDFDAERWYRILHDHQVSVWYTAPTAVRMMMRAGTELAAAYHHPGLRFIASVGEPLNPEAVWWGLQAFGLPIHDNWWQTETGGIMIANIAAADIRPGSMGRPLPGVRVGILRRDEHGRVVVRDGEAEEITEPMAEGELALRPGWPSMFRGYLDDPERTAACFVGGWYVTGDLARRDADGYVWFVGRGDDVISSAGHLIGPFEVESALMEHPAVAEAGVIGVPDAVSGEIVKAFVALRRGHEPTPELRAELVGFARRRLGAVVAPKEIEFSEDLPKTKSGKIVRRLLRARELGLPEGDLSTLEGR